MTAIPVREWSSKPPSVGLDPGDDILRPRPGPSRKERADVFALAGGHRDVETRLGRNIKETTREDLPVAVLAIELHPTAPGDDFHALRSVGTEVELSGEDDPEGLPGTILETHRVADHPTVEIDVGLGHHRHSAEFCRNRHERMIGESLAVIQAATAILNPARPALAQSDTVASQPAEPNSARNAGTTD